MAHDTDFARTLRHFLCPELDQKRGIKSLKILENLQEEIMNAGGRLYKVSELADISVATLLTIAVPNNIKVSFEHRKPRVPERRKESESRFDPEIGELVG